MEAERAAGVIEETIEALMNLADEPTLLNNVNHSAIWIEHSVRKILSDLPKKLGKSVYDSLLRAGQIAAEGTLVALIRSIPLKYWPVDMTTTESIQEASGGAILAALLKPFRLKKEPALKRTTFKQRLHALLIEPIKASVLEKIVLGGARAIQQMMANVARMLNPRKIADILIKGISTGLNRVQIMQELRNELGMTRSEAKRTARTEGARVATESNMAAYEELGDSVTGYMIHATPNPDSRYWHKHRSGTAYYKFPKEGQKGLRQMPRPPLEAEDPKERPEGAPQTAWNCILPGAIIEGTFDAAIRSEYSGKAIEIVTRQGRKLAITPNHPICTTAGMTRAGLIQVGDNLICSSNHVQALGSINKYNAPTTIENVFSAAQQLWPSRIEPAACFNFHGDTPVNKSNVDIVASQWVLFRDIEPTLFERMRYLGFPSTSIRQTFLPGNGTFHHDFDAIFLATPSLLRLEGILTPLEISQFELFSALRFGSGSQVNASRYKLSAKSRPSLFGRTPTSSGDAKFITELHQRFSSFVTLDDVVKVRQFDFSGHVYDLQSPYGFIIANNIYISNCLCYLQPLFAPIDGLPELPETAEHKIVPDVSIYANWFKQTTEKLKRRAVGSRRFDLVESLHGPNASYYHFIEDDGQLLSMDAIRAENANETMKRVARVSAYYQGMAGQRSRAIMTGAV